MAGSLSLASSPATLASSAENTTSAPVCWTLATSHVVTVSAAVSCGIAVLSFQLTTSPYCLPAERSLAHRDTMRKYGWPCSRAMNFCPTTPVQPRMATGIVRLTVGPPSVVISLMTRISHYRCEL